MSTENLRLEPLIPYSKTFNSEVYWMFREFEAQGAMPAMFSQAVSRAEFESALSNMELRIAYTEEFAVEDCSFLKIRDDEGCALLFYRNNILVMVNILDLSEDHNLRHRKQ